MKKITISYLSQEFFSQKYPLKTLLLGDSKRHGLRKDRGMKVLREIDAANIIFINCLGLLIAEKERSRVKIAALTMKYIGRSKGELPW